MKFQEMRMRMRKKGFEFGRDEIVKLHEKVGVKLPKMNIMMFEGTDLDRFLFWN